MLIMTQGNNSFVNMDRVAEIYVSATPVSAEVRASDTFDEHMSNEYTSLLGEYASVDRAKEVLAEIAKSFRSYYEYSNSNPFMFDPPKVYYMPAE